MLVVSVIATTLIPCVVADELVFPYMSAKGHLFRLLVALAVGGWAILAVIEPGARPRSSPILVALAAFVVVLGLTGALGVWPARSLLGNLERMGGWLNQVHLLGYFVVLSVALADERLWHRFFGASLAASSLVSGAALAQLAGMLPMGSPEGRVDGTLGNPSFLAAYLAFHIWLAGFLLLRESTPTRVRVVLGGLMALEGVALYSTATRSAMLGLVAGALVAGAVVLAWERERVRVRRLAGAVVVGVLLLGAGFAALRDHPLVGSNRVLGRFAAISPVELTSQSRLLAWQAALAGASERAWLGWGQENFSVVYARHYDPRLHTQDPFFDRPHNAFLQWLVAGGVPALLAYCAVLLGFLHLVWRGSTFSVVERGLLTGLAVGYAVHASLLFDTLTSFMSGTAVLAYVHRRATGGRERAGAPEGGQRPEWAVLAAALVVLAAASVGLTWRTVRAERAMLAAVRPDPAGPAGNLEWFLRALRHRTAATPKVRELLLATAVELGRSRPRDTVAMGRLAALAHREMARQIAECPLDVRSQVALASFLWRFSAFDEAEALLERAHALAPRMQHILFELGALQLERGRTDDAVESFRGAYELAPGWAEARVRYAAAAVVAGRWELAEGLLEPVDRDDLGGDAWLLAAFRASGDLPTLVQTWEARLGAVSSGGSGSLGLGRALDRARRALAERVMVDGFDRGTTDAWSEVEP